MNAVEIEEAVSALAAATFDAAEFPFAFLAAFGNKETTINRLRAGASNSSDVAGAILQRNHIHLATCATGAVAATLAALKASPRTAKNKCKFVVATDGQQFAAEELTSGEALECTFPSFGEHFGFFLPLDTKPKERATANIKTWADAFPYVNGGLFTKQIDVPKFSRTSRAYLLRAGELDWKSINPDIFGSMIQAVASDTDERGQLGMHYTSVPNILKVLNPLFLDDLNEQLDKAADNGRALLNLRKRIANIRVFDPACGSGNFLVIAYIKMREIEAKIVERRKESGDWQKQKSWIKLTNFYGIEIKSFAAEIARLALLIAEFQCNVRLIGQREARMDVLPLHDTGKIVTGNALRLDWLEVCPPCPAIDPLERDLAGPTGRLALDRPSATAETYICGNPPYLGGKKQTSDQKAEMASVFRGIAQFKNLDYVCAFFLKAADRLDDSSHSAFVTTNSICQGTHVPTFWPLITRRGCEIHFCHEPFKWSNNAKSNAGVSVSVLSIRKVSDGAKLIYSQASRRQVTNINFYLVDGPDVIVEPAQAPLNGLSKMITGNAPYDGGFLLLSDFEAAQMVSEHPDIGTRLRRVYGSSELLDGVSRFCLWFKDDEREFAQNHPASQDRIRGVLNYRRTGGEVAQTLIERPHQFRYRHEATNRLIVVPQVSSERRHYLPVGFLDQKAIVTHLAHAIYDSDLVDFAVLSSKLHLSWIATVCGKMKTDFRYSSTLGWNTFPVPTLTDAHKADLTRCAEDILLAREAHFPKTIADLYEPDAMPDDLRRAHDRNDETLERIYIGRRFKNDTERLEKLFDLYTKMTKAEAAKSAGNGNGKGRKKNGAGANGGST